MGFKAHEDRRPASLQAFASKNGLPPAQVTELEKVIEDLNSDLQKAVERVAVPPAKDADAEYRVIEEDRQGAMHRAKERLVGLTGEVDETALQMFMTSQLDEKTLRLMAPFISKYETEIERDNAEILNEWSRQRYSKPK